MIEFTEEEKGRLLDLVEDIARTNQAIASYLAIATAETVEAAFEEAFEDNYEREVYEAVNGKLGSRRIAEALGVGDKAVRTRIERLAKKGFIEKTGGKGEYQKVLSKAEIVQRFSKSNEGQ